MTDFSKFQDVFGQLIFLKSYTQLCIGFPSNKAITDDELVVAIQTAATKLTDAFPWLGGQVINEGSGPGNSGLFKIVPYEKHQKNPPVIVKKISELDYEEIFKKKAPASMLDGDVLAARKGIPLSYEKHEEPAEVFSIQVNFIKGGVILAFATQHNAMDMNAQGHLIYLFSKAMMGKPFTETELKEGNRDRRNVIPLLKDDEPLLDHSLLKVDLNAGPPEMHPAIWVYFRFSRAHLDELKEKAISSVSNGRIGTWLSTNDAVTTFFWQRLSAARQARLSPDDRTMLVRASNGRRSLNPPLPPAYMGHCVTCTFTPLTFKEISNYKLGDLAVRLRKELMEIDDYAIRSVVTLIARTPDKSTISYAASSDLSKDILFSSWAHQETQNLDYGVLGKPDFVRRQRFAPLESLCYLMPKSRNGDIDLAACLRAEDLAMLAKDEEWTKYTEYIG